MQVSRRIWGHGLLRLVILCPTMNPHRGEKPRAASSASRALQASYQGEISHPGTEQFS